MTIQRKHQAHAFSNGRPIEIWEANWDMAMLRSAIEEQARARKAELNGSGNPELLYFHAEIYPHLSACSTGDVPSLDEAFVLSDENLDRWYEKARKLNPSWFNDAENTQEIVTLSDGSQITVLSANRPSVLMRLARLEAEVEKVEPSDNIRTETFRLLYYPKMAACSIGHVPTLEEARIEWPESELNKWYAAVYGVNPQWFKPLEQLAEENKAAAESSEKKSKKPRARSSSS